MSSFIQITDYNEVKNYKYLGRGRLSEKKLSWKNDVFKRVLRNKIFIRWTLNLT